MADASATYTLNFDGNFAGGAAAAQAAGNQLADTLGRLEAATGKAGAAAGGASGAAAKLGGAMGGAGGAVGGAGDRAKGAGINLRALGGALQRTGGEAGSFLGHGVKLISLFGKLATSPIGIAIAIGVLSLALIAGVAAFAAYALSAADAARTQGLFAEAATGGAVAGAALEAQVYQLGGVTGLAAAKLQEMGLALARGGLGGAALARAFDAAAIAASAMGEAAGGKIKGIAEEAAKAKTLVLNSAKLQGTGVGLDDVAAALAKKMHVSLGQARDALQSGTVAVGAGLDALDDAVKSKLGGIAAKQALGLDAQLARLHTNIGSLFAGLKIEGFLGALHEALSVFDQTTISGKGLSAAVKGIAQPLIDGFAALLPLAKPFLQGMIIVALQVAIVFLRIRNAAREAFGGSAASANDMATAVTVGKVVMVGLLVVIGLIAAALISFGVAAAAIGAMVAVPLALVGAAIYGVYEAFVSVGESISTFWAGLDFASMGSAVIDGLVAGIKSGAAAVWNVVSGIGAGIKTAFSAELGIKSPSTVFRGYGMNTALGFAEGVDAGAGDVNASVSSMVQQPQLPAAAPRASAGAGRPVIIHINGVKNAEQLTDQDLWTRVCNMIERAADSVGAPIEVTP
jgi:hypothetical protein